MAQRETELTRRAVIQGGATLGTGLVLGMYLPARAFGASAPANMTALPGEFAPNAWLRIAPDNRIVILVDKSEMGQGIMTALPMILAEELEADWSLVSTEFAPNGLVYVNTILGLQATGGSTGVPSSWENLRRAGATAREMLLEAGARKLGVSPAECIAQNSKVIHEKSGKSFSYGELAESAATLPVPDDVSLKPKSAYTLIGEPLDRLDTKEKVEGRAVFGIDVELENMLVATTVHPPVFGATVSRLDAKRAEGMPGVRAVLEISSGVAVVADGFWQAEQAAGVLDIEWSSTGDDPKNDETIRAQLLARIDEKGSIEREEGKLDEALAAADKVLTATYETPYEAHQTAEPMNCTAHVTRDACEIWVPTQGQTIAEQIAAKVTGLGEDRIKVHTTYLGSGLGRRFEPDFVREAVEISKAVGGPVKLIWTRREDVQHDAYHPGTVIAMKGGLSKDGTLTAWSHHLVAPSHMAALLHYFRTSRIPHVLPQWLRKGISGAASLVIDDMILRQQATKGANNLPYAIENMRVSYTREEPGIPVGNWRSVAHHYNGFAAESFVDELAAAAGQDPMAFRLAMLKDHPRLANVLTLAAEMADWGSELPEGGGRGIAIHDYDGTCVAHVAEIRVAPDGELTVKRICAAVDCGIVINPKIVVQQVESAVAFGLTAALKPGVRIEEGRVMQSNFHDAQILRMDEMPEVEVRIVDSSETPTGMGEINVPVVAPAVVNAIFAATGKRIRKLPITSQDLETKS